MTMSALVGMLGGAVNGPLQVDATTRAFCSLVKCSLDIFSLDIDLVSRIASVLELGEADYNGLADNILLSSRN